MIEVDNVVKRYGSLEALAGISFTVDSGEIVGLLGPNGAGKTTMMKVLTCYHYPNSGNARLNNYNIFSDADAVKHSLGYLPENAPLYQDLKVSEYLDFIADSRSLNGKNRKERLDWVIESCGLEEVINRSIAKISKGYRQRTGLAQAIIHDPSILILDEPTTGLDPKQIIEIRKLIKELGKKKTVILSTHILQEVEAVCDRVLILNEGKIVAGGTTEEIGSEIKGEDIFTLVLLGEASEKARNSLRGLPSLKKLIEFDEIRGSRLKMKCSMESRQNGAEQLFDWAVENKYKILEMKPESYSLEDIFIKLTTETGRNE